jgi:uncharacterized protein DUF4145
MEQFMEPFQWTCPFCNRVATVTEGDVRQLDTFLDLASSDGDRYLLSTFTVCPNPECRRFTLDVQLRQADCYDEWVVGDLTDSWRLIPPSCALVFPEYVPQAIRDDYEEACLIAELSPKASATLARRCLQGIIRDFWQVKPGRLVDEIDAIEDKVDTLTWDAIDSVRKIGNIGAHMEKNINHIVEVDDEEAQLLVGLIENLIREWYIARHEREEHLKAIKGIATQKDVERKKGQTNA